MPSNVFVCGRLNIGSQVSYYGMKTTDDAASFIVHGYYNNRLWHVFKNGGTWFVENFSDELPYIKTNLEDWTNEAFVNLTKNGLWNIIHGVIANVQSDCVISVVNQYNQRMTIFVGFNGVNYFVAQVYNYYASSNHFVETMIGRSSASNSILYANNLTLL